MDGDASANTGPTPARWWGPTAAASSASTDVMNQLCRVCGEPAAGFHFGAFTCEGCKSFFGRTYNNLSSISDCKNNGECVINKKNRTSCKACRLRKCLLVGMSKSGSRYGRRSNWFKIHCLLQEQQQQASSNQAAMREPLGGKNKMPLWDGASHRMPTLMDADNNNSAHPKGTFFDGKNRTLSPSDLLPMRGIGPASHPGYSTTGQAAAALWAARNSLLPIQVSTHHHMNHSSLHPLPVPFLTSPFLHGAGFHPHAAPPPRNFILPFVQQMSSPKPHNSETHVSNLTSSSSSSTSSSPPSPLREQKQGTSESSKSDHRFKVSTEKGNSFERSVAVLQALGPMQEQPIDLSLRGNTHDLKSKYRRKSRGESCSEENTEQEDLSSDSDDLDSCEGKTGGDATDMDSGESDKKPTSTPLDLTTRT